MANEEIYTVTFLRDGELIDQFRVCGPAFEEASALADHRKWNPNWPDHLLPDAAVCEIERDDLPELPPEFHWVEREPYKIILAHTETGKRYGVRTFGPDPLGQGAEKEIAYGIAKINREIERDGLINNQETK